MCRENPTWGASRICDELHYHGLNYVESTVAIYMAIRNDRDRPCHSKKCFFNTKPRYGCHGLPGNAESDISATVMLSRRSARTPGDRTRQLDKALCRRLDQSADCWIISFRRSIKVLDNQRDAVRQFTSPVRRTSALRLSILKKLVMQ